jgi:predicted transposase/invertase (TIGR01784 family)
VTYDNVCKYLAEQHPASFVRWLLGIEAADVRVLKTELNLEPIRADSVTFLQTNNQILHLEFQTLPASEPPLPFRMLDYWVRLHRQYRSPIEQIVLFLKPTNAESVFVEQFQADKTLHRYRAIRLWEQDPSPFFADPVLLPFAALAQTNCPPILLERVAVQVAMMETTEQQNIAVLVQLLAGLRFDKKLIRQFFREGVMRESVIYQEIYQEGRQEGERKGRQEGEQKGRQEGERKGRQEGERELLLRLLTRKFGAIASLQEQICLLSVDQLESLGEAMLDFSDLADLVAWLEANQNFR